MALFQVEPADTGGLFYVRTWGRDGSPPEETKFTDRKAAEAHMRGAVADRSYQRVEFLQVIEWIERIGRSRKQMVATP